MEYLSRYTRTWKYFGVGTTCQLTRFVVICKKVSKSQVKAFNGGCPVKKLENRQLQNTLKQLKGLNLTLLKLICFLRTFITCSNYFKGTFTIEHIFSEHLFLNTCFTINYFFDELYHSVFQYL